MLMDEQFYLGDIEIESSWLAFDDSDNPDDPNRHLQFHAKTGTWHVFFDHMGLEGDRSQLWMVCDGYENIGWDEYCEPEEIDFTPEEGAMPNTFGNICEIWSSGFAKSSVCDLSDGCVLAEYGLICTFDENWFMLARLEDDGATVAVFCEF